MAAHYKISHSTLPLPNEFVISQEEINKLKELVSKVKKKRGKAKEKSQSQEDGSSSELLDTAMID